MPGGNESKLYAHQRMLIEKYKDSSEIAIFAEAGTGKSLTVLEIATYKFAQGAINALLVIAPNRVDRQWEKEQIPLWMKDVPYVTWPKKSKSFGFSEGKLNIVCTNIEQFSTDTTYRKYVDWALAHKTMIVLDEATSIKTPKAMRTQRLLYGFNNVVKRGKTILNSTPKTVARAILTGTPITNGPFDVWSMFEFLRPGYFGLNWYAFQNKYGIFYQIMINGRNIRILINEQSWRDIKRCTSYEQAMSSFGVTLSAYDYISQQDHYSGPYRNIDSLRQKICEIATFIKIEDCIDMPERTYNIKKIAMDSEQARVYKEMERYLISVLDGEGIVEAKTKMAAMIRLQQIADGFASLTPDVEDPGPNEIRWFDKSPKIDQLLIDCEEIVDRNNTKGQLIIVTHFSAEAERIFNVLAARNEYRVCLMTGWKRVGSIEAFKAHEYDIMVANIRVIAKGFNLQEHCAQMIFYSNTFSLEDRIQCEARIYRSGQHDRCIYTDYIADGTVDMKIYAALRQHKELADYIRDKSATQIVNEYDDTVKAVFN